MIFENSLPFGVDLLTHLSTVKGVKGERYVLQVLCLHENIDVKAYIPIGPMGLVFFRYMDG